MAKAEADPTPWASPPSTESAVAPRVRSASAPPVPSAPLGTSHPAARAATRRAATPRRTIPKGGATPNAAIWLRLNGFEDDEDGPTKMQVLSLSWVSRRMKNCNPTKDEAEAQ